MTFDEIQAEINKMPRRLSDGGWIAPHVEFDIKANEKPCIYMRHNGGSEFVYGNTPSEVIEKTWAFIDAMPDPQSIILKTYVKKLADAVDYGYANAVPSELVDPVRMAQKATSDMMLPAPKIT